MGLKTELIKNSELILNGKKEEVKLSLCAILSNGHVLIEDVPGVGKTTLVKTIAEAFSLKLSRIQFTNDILPSDIIGVNVFNRETSDFKLHKGPIFGDIILADELNRAPAKTQSALLQAMEEGSVDIEGKRYQLPKTFCVFATQNPSSQIGTFDLPESQLDRFSLKFDLGYTDKESTIQMFKMNTSNQNKEIYIKNKIHPSTLEEYKKKVHTCRIDDSLLEYIFQLLKYSRDDSEYNSLSNRCGQDIVNLSKAYAVISQRNYVIPSDIKYLFPFITGHRLVANSHNIKTEQAAAKSILENVPIR